MASTDDQSLLGVFLTLSCLYWAIHQGTELLIKKYKPTLYQTITKDNGRTQLLGPLLGMVVRLLYGIFLTLPACAHAAYTTSWELNQPISESGVLCLASQTAPWVSELHMQLDTNVEVFIHHILCLGLMANFLIAPNVFLMKPMYLYFGSQCGDVTVSLAKILRNSGHDIATSWPLWLVKFASTNVLMLSKVGIAMYTIGNVFISPYRLMDWIWVICLLFFATYTELGVYANLTYLGIWKPCTQGPVGRVFRNGLVLTRFHMTVICSVITAVIVNTWAYACLLDYDITSEEHRAIWLTSILLAGSGCLFIKVGTFMWTSWTDDFVATQDENPYPKRGQIYLGFGCSFAPVAINFIRLMHMFTRNHHINHQVLGGAIGFTLPVWDAILRCGVLMSIGENSNRNTTEQQQQQDDEQASKRSSVPRAQNNPEPNLINRRAQQELDRLHARKQMRLIFTDVTILATPFIFGHIHHNLEWTYAVLMAYSMIQFFNELNPYRVLPAQIRELIPTTTTSFENLKFALCSEGAVLSIATVYLTLLGKGQKGGFGLFWSAFVMSFVSLLMSWRIHHNNSDDNNNGRSSPRRRQTRGVDQQGERSQSGNDIAVTESSTHRILRCCLEFCIRPMVFTAILATFLQGCIIWEVKHPEKYEIAPEIGTAMGNLRVAMGSPIAILGNTMTMMLGTSIVLME